MILNEDVYVPVLSWRQGEYQALMRLKPCVKYRIMPLVCIPKVEFDFEAREDKKTVNDHVLPFVRRYNVKWGTRPAWIALNNTIARGHMDNGSHVFDYIFDGLRPKQAKAAPAVTLGSDTDTIAAAARAVGRDGHGVGIIVSLENLMVSGLREKVVKLTSSLTTKLEEADLIIDLRAPNFRPFQPFAKGLIAALRHLGDLSVFRNLVLVSTAIPDSFGAIARGIDEIPRHDWLFYQALLGAMPTEMRRPNYGDYTIVHPDFAPMDMRMIKPAGKIVYTTTGFWATCKGGAFRDNPAQMHDHCAAIVNDPKFQFRGAAFSYGDDYIAKCAVRKEGPSNQSRWKCVTINHHMTTVVHDLASAAASP